MDEVPLYMDMCRGWTLAEKGSKAVEVNFTNSDKLRFTGVACVSSTGEKLQMSAIFRLTKAGNIPPELRDPFTHEVQVYCADKGSMTSELMEMWLDDVLEPYLDDNGGGEGDEYALLLMDPAKPHLTENVRRRCRELNVDLAIMPASTTWKYQMVDVVVNKPFKDGIYEEWANWMLNKNDELGLTKAKNRRHPTRPNVLDWVQASWTQ